MIESIRFALLKKKIRNNPYIGEADIDGTYLYRQGGYSIRYRVIKLADGQTGIEWVSLKRRLGAYEERARKLKEGFFEFWHYQKWFIFFRPPIILILIIIIIFFYSEVMETQEVKTNRLKWVIASAIGISAQDIQYIGDGRLEISGQRQRRQDKKNEPIKYSFNPLRWLFFSEGGVLGRQRGEPFGYTTHPVVFNDKGDVWIKKPNAAWQHGIISGQSIKWDKPMGSANIIEQKEIPSEMEISLEDKKLKIIDK